MKLKRAPNSSQNSHSAMARSSIAKQAMPNQPSVASR